MCVKILSLLLLLPPPPRRVEGIHELHIWADLRQCLPKLSLHVGFLMYALHVTRVRAAFPT